MHLKYRGVGLSILGPGSILDFAGPMLNCMFLVVVDAHTKWIEVFPMSNRSALFFLHSLAFLRL